MRNLAVTVAMRLSWPREFRKVIRFIKAATNKRNFRAMRSLNFEKLKGSDEQYSMRLNKQWRLIVVEIKENKPKNIIVVVDIVDYHD